VQKPPLKQVSWVIPSRPLGAHMSIAGGVDLAIARGISIGCAAVQMFTKSNNQWAARPLPDDEVLRFRTGRARHGNLPVVAHDSYLINLCSPDDRLYDKSVDACLLELERCARLGIETLVVHPGAHMGQGEQFAIRRLAEAIDRIHDRVPRAEASIALETMAGQGTAIGHRFEQIARVIALTRDPDRVGVCFDTCHVFAAGYDLRTPSAYEETLRAFAGEIGLARLRAIHVNDSKRDIGSRVDRHEHIGKGFLGLEAFRLLMNDARLLHVPLLLETPKDEKTLKEDVENLDRLIRLVARRPGRRPSRQDAAAAGGRP
jgi:deoxyribonuclease-4